MSLRVSGLFILMLQCAVVPAAAQSPAAPDERPLSEMAIEDLLRIEVDTVESASKFVQDVSQAPASVTVITAEEIRLQGYRTLADVLRSVRGLYVSYDRNYSYVGIRGFQRPGDYNDRILVLVDGQRLNDEVYGAALIGTDLPLDLAVIDRVEVIRGPSSSLYGTNAVFGVINLITRRPAGVRHGEITAEAGGLATARLNATIAGRHRSGWAGLVSTGVYTSAGESQLFYPEYADSPSGGLASHLDNDRARSLYAAAERGGFSVQGLYGRRQKDVPTGAFATLFDVSGTETTDAQALLAARYSVALGPHATLSSRISYQAYRYEGRYMYDMGDGDPIVPGAYLDSATADTLGAEVSVARRFVRHTVTIGGETRWSPRANQGSHDWSAVYLDDRHQLDTSGAFAQDEFRAASWLLLNGGVRLDTYDTIAATVNPRLAAIVTPRRGTDVKVLLGRAYRAPSLYELYYYPRGDGRLEPETIWTGEVSWDQRLSTSLTVSAAVYRYRVDDLISTKEGEPGQPESDLRFVNDASATAIGAELEAAFSLRAIRLRAAHSAGRARDEQTHARLSNSPARLSQFSALVPLGSSRFVAGLNAQWMGERLGVSGNPVPGAFVANLTLTRKRVGPFDVSASVYNLFDRAYQDPGAVEHVQAAIPQDGRTALARVSWKF